MTSTKARRGPVWGRRPTPKAAQASVDRWNAAHRIGTAVDVREDDDRITRTTTRSEAWLLGGHTAVVLLDDRSGCFALDRCTAVDA